jgi:hypothetical protein
MPSIHNGSGTMYYGKRDVDIGGSYVTTEWIVFFWLPILPLSSWRVFPLTDELVTSYGTRQAYQARPVSLNWAQVLNVYLLTAGCLAGAWYVFSHYIF